MTADAPGGLSAAELRGVVAELQALRGARLVDVVVLDVLPSADDLLLVLQKDQARREFLHLALGGRRARLTTTARRFPRSARRSGRSADVLALELADAELEALSAADTERICRIEFATPRGRRTVAIELFGSRGLWALLDSDGRVLTLSRPIAVARRTLVAGDIYRPPPAPSNREGEEPTIRFPTPMLPAIDATFTAADLAASAELEGRVLRRAATRAEKKARRKRDGLRLELEASERTDALRERADLMLAYAHTVSRGADRMRVVDPESGEPREFAIDPARPVIAQAEALYQRARRLEAGREIAAERLERAEEDLRGLEAVRERLEAIDPATEQAAAALEECRRRLGGLGALPRERQEKKERRSPVRSAPTPGENFRRFVSAEGYPILVGRNNLQNDRLTMRFANGNDLWLHVGGGRPGSHVVVRLPRQKTASLETLLDAATLAVHFSKARGEGRVEVIYTQRKHVRKPRGLPPGAVVPSQTRTIQVEGDEGRLRRLLDTARPEG